METNGSSKLHKLYRIDHGGKIPKAYDCCNSLEGDTQSAKWHEKKLAT